MKRTVRLSTYSTVMSIVGLVIMTAVFFYALCGGRAWLAYILGVTVMGLCTVALLYIPMSISVTDKDLCINRPLWTKRLPLSYIRSIELMQPTMGERLIIGSRGWSGYWGLFSEKDLGRYFAYYGKASDCFFVRLKDGRQYMLGCTDPSSIVDYVKGLIS